MSARVAASALLAAALLATACGCSSGVPLRPPPPPGYQSPANAVAGYIGNMMRTRTAAACGYVAPSISASCPLVLDALNFGGKLSGSWSVGASVTWGTRAIVAVEYLNACLGSMGCLNNSDPHAGLPHAGLSFNAAYQQALTSSVQDFATDCVLVNGRWYVWDQAPGSG